MEVRNLVVRYGRKVAVNGLSFRVNKGEIYCLLGPNGAGKTSTIKAIAGLVKYSGSIDILGMGPPSSRVMNSIGVVLETPLILETLTPAEFIEFVASVRGKGLVDMKLVETLINAFELSTYMNTPMAALSMGNRQKMAIIAAFMHRPRLVLLDEPLNFLDVKSARVVKELIQRHVKDGGSILFSTHIIEIAEKVCDRIGIINDGVLVIEGNVEEIEDKVNAGSLEEALLKAVHADEEIRHIVEVL